MSLVARVVVLAVGSLAVFAQACTLASPTHITEQPAADSKGDDDDSTGASSSSGGASSSSGGASAAAGTCTNPQFTKPDVSTLTACGKGGGHCYDATMVPGGPAFLGQDTCTSSQLCVPDEVLNANGGKLTSCQESLLNTAGACINLQLMPQALAQGGSELKADSCTGGLTCVPCTDPTHGNAPTGLCGPLGVTSTPCTGAAGSTGTGTTTPPAAAGCCTTNGVSNGTCLPTSAIPSNASSMTIQDSCSTGNSCVPAALVSGTPKTCDGGILALGGASVCIDKCFSSGVEGQLEGVALSQDACGTTEVCVPCNLIKLAAGSTPVPGCGN